MEYHDAYKRFTTDLDSDARWALIKGGAWLRLAFIAASVALMGPAMLVSGDATPAIAVLMAMGGAALCIYSWRRCRAALEAVDAPTVTPVAPNASESIGALRRHATRMARS